MLWNRQQIIEPLPTSNLFTKALNMSTTSPRTPPMLETESLAKSNSEWSNDASACYPKPITTRSTCCNVFWSEVDMQLKKSNSEGSNDASACYPKPITTMSTCCNLLWSEVDMQLKCDQLLFKQSDFSKRTLRPERGFSRMEPRVIDV